MLTRSRHRVDEPLQAVGEEGGIAPEDHLSAMRAICAGPSVEPEVS